MEELLAATTTGILRHIATEEVTQERERKEEERRRAEEERCVFHPCCAWGSVAAGESLPRPRVLLLLPAALVGLTAHPAPLYTVAQGVGDVQGNGMGWLCDLLLGPEGSGLPTQHNSDPLLQGHRVW